MSRPLVTVVTSRTEQLTAGIRFFAGMGAALGISILTKDPKLGGYAALAVMMGLLSDTYTTVPSRLAGIATAYLCMALAVAGGVWIKQLSQVQWLYVWLVIFVISFFSSDEAYWAIVGKYAAILLMISLFDFQPDRQAIVGYSLGFVLAGLISIIDSVVWKVGHLGRRPLEELKLFFGGNRNSAWYAVIVATALVLGIASAKWLQASEPAWVGVTVLFVMNVDDSTAFKRIAQRIIGTLAGYLICLISFPYMQALWVQALVIMTLGFLIPITLLRNYLVFSTVITVFILTMLNWLLMAYGGDGSLLRWRFLDTLLGAAWAVVALLIMRMIRWHLQQKKAS